MEVGEQYGKSSQEDVSRRAWKSLSPQIATPARGLKRTMTSVFLLRGRRQADSTARDLYNDTTREIPEVGPGETEGASPPAGKMSSTLFSIETGTAQVTHDQPQPPWEALVSVHLMKSRRMGSRGQREEKFLPPPTREGTVRGQGSPAVSPFLKAQRRSEWTPVEQGQV